MDILSGCFLVRSPDAAHGARGEQGKGGDRRDDGNGKGCCDGDGICGSDRVSKLSCVGGVSRLHKCEQRGVGFLIRAGNGPGGCLKRTRRKNISGHIIK